MDILSNQDLRGLVQKHEQAGNDITLLTSGRESSRKLIFDSDCELKGWHNNVTDEYRPDGFKLDRDMTEEAFSGIYVLGADAVKSLADYSHRSCRAKFPIMDYLLSHPDGVKIRKVRNDRLRMLDIGKPDALVKAGDFISSL